MDISRYPHLNKAVYSLITKNSSVLDIGCWTGTLGKSLIKNKQCQVDGLDAFKEPLKIASKNGYQKTYLLDLNNLKKLAINNKKYDYLVFSDVLEHILHPEEVLKFFIKHNLKKSGKIIVSLPNIAFIYYRLKILSGNFDYKEVGAMDNSHVKFYTLKTMRKLIKNSNLKIIKEIKYNELSGWLSIFKVLSKLWSTLFTLQYVFLLKKSR